VAIMFWAEAVKAAGKDDVEAMKKAWEGLEYDSIAGHMATRDCDHQTIRPVWCAEIAKKERVL
jgi:hypothetical protein